MVAVRRVHTGDRNLDDAQRVGRDSAKAINRAVFTNGVLLTEEDGQPDSSGLVFTIATPRSIKHNLGRKAVGWIEVYAADLASAAHVGLKSTAHPAGLTSETHVTVTPAASGTCFLFVF